MIRRRKATLGSRATGRNGVITAPSPEAAQAGLHMLIAGGNAADAAAAVLLTSCITRIGYACLGGEAAVIIFDARRGQAKVLAAQGAAPLDPRAVEWIRANDGPLEGIRSATTPAMLDLCVTLLGEFGTMSFGEVAAPALALLEQGRSPIYFDSSLRKRLDALTGETVRWWPRATPARDWSADLTQTLRRLVHSERSSTGSRLSALEAVADTFRHGEIATQLARWYGDRHGFLGMRDLEAHRTVVEDPLALDYRGYRVLKADTWTQGLWLLHALRVLDVENISGSSEAERCHVIAEVVKLALDDRDHHFGDPRFVSVPTAQLLSEDYAEIRRAVINPDTAITAKLPGDPVGMRAHLDRHAPSSSNDRSTIACITADRLGNMVVMTPSGVGSTAGSGGTTGLTHGSRLGSANTETGHPNCIAPGKRPCVTLSPTLVLESGRPWLAISVPGGSFQDQVALQLILAFIDRGMRLTDIVERDAESTPVLTTKDSKGRLLLVQKPYVEVVGDALRKRGHRVKPTSLSLRTFGGSVVYADPETGELDAFGMEAAAY